MSTVKTNKSDYKPGSKVLITASDFSSDATIQFEVLNLGDDGVQGTAMTFLTRRGQSQTARVETVIRRPGRSAPRGSCRAAPSTRRSC